MKKRLYRLRFWGVRGTIPTPTRDALGAGGNTVCLAASLSDERHIILDLGTGLRLFGNHLAAQAKGSGPDRGMGRSGGARRREAIRRRFDVFLSHYHFDHIQGLPFFHPLYDRNSAFTFHGFDFEGKTVREIMEGFMAPPYFPVRLSGVPSKLSYANTDRLPKNVEDVRVHCLPLHHPNGSLAFRLDHGDRRIVFATDHEHGIAETDAALVRFSQDADYLIYDATYPVGEYESLRRGWGHSTWYAAVQAARSARVGTLILFHHHPEHSDRDLRDILRIARKELPKTLIAQEGMELPF